jgi:hypothetical protein
MNAYTEKKKPNLTHAAIVSSEYREDILPNINRSVLLLTFCCRRGIASKRMERSPIHVSVDTRVADQEYLSTF